MFWSIYVIKTSVNRYLFLWTCEFLWSHSKEKMIQIFQTIRGLLAFLGLSLEQSIQPHHSFNTRLLLGFLTVSLAITLHILYLVFVANTLIEYMQCIGITFAAIANGFAFGNIVYNSKYLFECLVRVQKTIDARKFEI